MEIYPRSYTEDNIKMNGEFPIIFPWGYDGEGGTMIYVVHYMSGRMRPLNNHQLDNWSFSIIKIFVPYFVKNEPFGMIENLPIKTAETYFSKVRNSVCEACRNDDDFVRYHDLCSGQSLFHPLSYTLPVESGVLSCRKLCRFHIE